MTVRGSVAFVATAKHCVERVSTAVFGPARDDPSLSAAVTYANGDTGTLQPIRHRFFWHTNRDDVVIAMTFTAKPTAYDTLCPSCFGLQPWGPAQLIPVVSVLEAGGGEAVISSGQLWQNDDGQWRLLLPVAPGTSGAPVVDAHGNLIGIASSTLVSPGTEAGFRAEVVPGKYILDLVKSAVENAHDDLAPTVDPASGLAGQVIRASADQTAFVVRIDRTGQEHSLKSSTPCNGIEADDRVLLYHEDQNGGSVRMSTPSTVCYLRESP